MAADAAVSAGVVIAGMIIFLTGWRWIDPIASLTINVVIVWGTSSLLRESLAMALHLVPANVHPGTVREYLEDQSGFRATHYLHIWPFSTPPPPLTLHYEMPNGGGDDEFLHSLCEHLHDQFAIEHSTMQIEQNADACSLAPDRNA